MDVTLSAPRIFIKLVGSNFPRRKLSIRDAAKLFGPAWLALLADADAASIIGGLVSGEQYGYKLIWFVLLLAFPLFVIQEASGLLGAISGKGIGELIRVNYSRKIASLVIFPVFFVDFFTYLAEYTGIFIGSFLLGINPIYSLLLFFTLHLTVVATRGYEVTERILLITSFSLLGLSFIPVLPRLPPPSHMFYFALDRNFLFYLVINVGAVVTPPSMIIYQSCATGIKYSKIPVEKNDKVKWVKLETILGSLITELIIVFSEIIGTGIGHVNPIDPVGLRESLGGTGYAPGIFGALLISAGFLALVVVSLSSSWGISEALAINSLRNNFIIYSFESLPAVILLLLMGNNYSEIFNFALDLLSISPLVICVPGIIVGKLVSRKDIMGQYAYSSIKLLLYYLIISIIVLTGSLNLIFTL